MTDIASLFQKIIQSVNTDASIPPGILVFRGSETWSAYHVASKVVGYGTNRDTCLRNLARKLNERALLAPEPFLPNSGEGSLFSQEGDARAE